MSRNHYIIEAHRYGAPITKLAVDHKLSRSWIHELIKRHKKYGPDGLLPRSRRPCSNPNQYDQNTIDLIISLRKQLTSQGYDGGARTIWWHLKHGHNLARVPSVSTIWRILKREGLITPQPRKRPKTSYTRFEADLPNQCWQSDVTHIALADGTEVEIVNIIDDHSRLNIASVAVPVCKGADIVAAFKTAFNSHGLPQSVLTDNGAVYTTRHLGGESAFTRLLKEHDIDEKHGRPYHPTTQGKVERFHQTQKNYLKKQSIQNIEELQNQLNIFKRYYNTQRPHRARNCIPQQAYEQRLKAYPIQENSSSTYRIRKDRVDDSGKTTLRWKNRLLKLAVGRKHKKQAIVTLQHDNETQTYNTQTGEQIAQHQLNPNKNYQPNQKSG